MNYKNQYQRKAHQEIDFIFLTLLPQTGLSVREEQVKLSHQMLDTLLEGENSPLRCGCGDWENICLSGSLCPNAKICGGNGKRMGV